MGSTIAIKFDSDVETDLMRLLNKIQHPVETRDTFIERGHRACSVSTLVSNLLRAEMVELKKGHAESYIPVKHWMYEVHE